MIRDAVSNALLETDAEELQKYRREKRRDREILQLREELKVAFECINRLNETVKRLEQR